MRRITIHSPDELRLFNTSCVDNFALEAEHDAAPEGRKSLFAFVCDEADGPVVVRFGLDMPNVDIDLAALRRLLDDAEGRLLEMRREDQAVFPMNDGM